MRSRDIAGRRARAALAAALVALVALVALWTTPAAAQTRFAWPDTAVDLASYTTLEECGAAVSRVLDMTKSRAELASGVWRDTIPYDRRERDERLSDPVPLTARSCMAPLAAVDSVAPEDFARVLWLHLLAGWDDRARALIDRRIAAIEPKDEEELLEVIQTVIDISGGRGSMTLRPPRRDIAREVVLAHLPRVSDRIGRMRIYSNFGLFGLSDSTDTATVRAIARHVGAIVDSLTDRERAELEEMWGAIAETDDFESRIYAMLYRVVAEEQFLDSLRASTEAYVRMKRRNWTETTGMRPETYLFGSPIGERAPAIVGGIRLGFRDPAAPRPTPGRISLVVFLDAAGCIGVVDSPTKVNGRCANDLVALRRLEERFPQVEITVVSQTHGYFSYLKDSLPPEREARLIKQWLESFGVDAPLVVTTTDAWRLDAPDRRRIERLSENRASYSFGRSSTVRGGGAYLIDEDGLVVHTRQINRHSLAEDYGELIEILLERQAKAKTGA